MSNFSIGMSGLNAARSALEIIGNNIANAATPGYHRQRIELNAAYASQYGNVLLGGGVDVEGITRMMDSLLEQEILRQRSILGHVSQEFSTMRTVESTFGELSTKDGGLNAAIDDFFNALSDLSANPGGVVWQNQAISAAEVMASQFRALGSFLTTLETEITLEAENCIEQINALISHIAELNGSIKRLEISGVSANNLKDQRDQCITELSELIGVQTLEREYGVVDVTVGGIQAVMGSSYNELAVGLNQQSELGVTISGAYNYDSDVEGGRLGGLLSLKNSLISDVHSDLDDLARAIIQQINQYHVQGVGSEGSFTELTGWLMTDEELADFDTPITGGSVFIRVTDTTVPGTTTITRHEIDIANDLPANPTLSDFADYITNNITGLTASVQDSKLYIQADTGYEFDFLPGVLSEPTTNNLTGGSVPNVSISGIYTGSAKQTYTCTVVGDGDVGIDSSLQIQVKNGNDEVVKTVNVGAGYAAGETLSIGDGLYISIGTGTLNDTETFTIEALGNSDTSGVLAAVGINTFFSGGDASEVAVCSDITATPGRIATALGAEMTDNTNVRRMAELKDQTISSLNSQTPGEFYRQLVTNVGEQLFIKQMRQDNLEGIVQNLANQQTEISGVDINEQAAQMLVFEQMFQAMAKYLSTVQSSISSLMEII